MVDLIENIKNDPIGYYIGLLIGIALISLIIFLILKNKQKKKAKMKEIAEEKARIEKHVDLESMIAKMQEQEQSKLKDTDPVANFEQEQEENAIISYQELVNAVKSETKEPINVINVSSTGDVLSTTSISRNVTPDEPVFIDEIKLPKTEIEFDPQEDIIVENPKINPVKEELIESLIEIEEDDEADIPSFDSIFTETVNKNDGMPAFIEQPRKMDYYDRIKELETEPLESKPNPGKFKSSEFISPIYGRQNSNISYPTISSFKNNISDEEIINISGDIDPNDEFLKTLRDYRN